MRRIFKLIGMWIKKSRLKLKIFKQLLAEATDKADQEFIYNSGIVDKPEVISMEEAIAKEEVIDTIKTINKSKDLTKKKDKDTVNTIDKVKDIAKVKADDKMKTVHNEDVVVNEEVAVTKEEVVDRSEAIVKMMAIDKDKSIGKEESFTIEEIIAKAQAIEKEEAVAYAQTIAKSKVVDKQAEVAGQAVGPKSRAKDMPPPFLSYITFNRMGLTARSLKSILDTPEDFEMHIIDSNSQDDTWEYLQSIKDSRIKSKTRLALNIGPVFALNKNLSRRKKDQYYFTVDSDVVIKTKDWITRFMEVFDEFPEVGLLGVQRTPPYIPVYPKVITKSRNGATYLELKNGYVDVLLDFVHGCCMGMRPELIERIGYWSEETCYGDGELSPRILNFTEFKAGFMSDQDWMPLIDIDMTQEITCEECIARQYCKLDKNEGTCFNIHAGRYKNTTFAQKFKWKYLEFFKELEEGKRTAYCASIYDPVSIATHEYNREWAQENMEYYIENSNENNNKEK